VVIFTPWLLDLLGKEPPVHIGWTPDPVFYGEEKLLSLPGTKLWPSIQYPVVIPTELSRLSSIKTSETISAFNWIVLHWWYGNVWCGSFSSSSVEFNLAFVFASWCYYAGNCILPYVSRGDWKNYFCQSNNLQHARVRPINLCTYVTTVKFVNVFQFCVIKNRITSSWKKIVSCLSYDPCDLKVGNPVDVG
jgi:hypothetical protein